ncbi:hypothetical protein HHI36_013266 [Cryptolaemus montrouzieri]|uniref:Uncharacterized protein n=1 Tax=Cryptolaemus montrouzieri TaxID=559131 RepID=A0ABD2NHR7_9CUCU
MFFRQLSPEVKNAVQKCNRQRDSKKKIKSSANLQRTTWRVINANSKEPKFKDIECTITVDEFNKFFNKVSKLLAPTVADTEE